MYLRRRNCTCRCTNARYAKCAYAQLTIEPGKCTDALFCSSMRTPKSGGTALRLAKHRAFALRLINSKAIKSAARKRRSLRKDLSDLQLMQRCAALSLRCWMISASGRGDSAEVRKLTIDRRCGVAAASCSVDVTA